ncbi:MAG: tetratricopeptide repeat protein [Candidatus Krumholzibacteria bacterium]|nr:tetratricopeptide repeat protein [Candidatus Krumholzibacteria bacterium]
MRTKELYRLGLSAALLSALVLDSGCWGRKFFRAPGETIETSTKVDSLLKENMVLQRRVYNLEKMLSSQQDYDRSVNAQTRLDLEELKDRLNALSQMLEESGAKPAAGPAAGRSRALPSAGAGALPDTLAGSGPAGAAGAGPGGRTGSVPVPSAEEIHRQTYLDFSRMEYQIALDESQAFLENYPDHPLGQEVRFVRGECYMELGKHFDALKEFSAVLQDYPRGKKVPPSLLRMAVCYDAIGDRGLSAGVVRRLVREYPASEEAAVAKERFADLLE